VDIDGDGDLDAYVTSNYLGGMEDIPQDFFGSTIIPPMSPI